MNWRTAFRQMEARPGITVATIRRARRRERGREIPSFSMSVTKFTWSLPVLATGTAIKSILTSVQFRLWTVRLIQSNCDNFSDVAPVEICLGANAHVEKDDADAPSWGGRAGGLASLIYKALYSSTYNEQ